MALRFLTSGESHGPALLVILEGIQDPGNAGAILRTAEAFRATGAVFLKGTANPYNPKAKRRANRNAFHNSAQ